MSHGSVAAALGLREISTGERLVAYALASFANSEHRAWPGTRIAAARAGLSHSQYLSARASLARRGLVTIESAGGGRGRSPIVLLQFARTGPWWEAEINAPAFESLLSYSRSRGAARALLATLAALSDDDLVVRGVAVHELRAAAGMADSTYRRARAVVLASGEANVDVEGGGRGRVNQWSLRAPEQCNPAPVRAARERSHAVAARPLIATVHPPVASNAASNTLLDSHHDRALPGDACVREENAAEARRLTGGNGPVLSGVRPANPVGDRMVSSQNGPGSSAVPLRNPAAARTVSHETPPVTPPETPPPHARAGGNLENPRTEHQPPNPPQGGTKRCAVSVVETYVTDRGRRRERTVMVDVGAVLADLGEPSPRDRSDWQRARVLLEASVTQSMFEIWFEDLELVATTAAGALVLSCPHHLRSGLRTRYGSLIARGASQVGREAQVGDDRQLAVLSTVALSTPGEALDLQQSVPTPHEEAV